MRFKIAAAAVVCLLSYIGPSGAETFPDRYISLLVPGPAGGPADAVARLIGQSMSKTLGQQITIENVSGAGGTIASARTAKATPDGYTVLLHHVGFATAATLYRQLPFDPLNDFETIGLVTEVPMTIVARKNFPPADTRALLAYLKAEKDKTTLGNAGVGSASHLCGMQFMSAIGAALTTVPYKGTAPAMSDLLAGQIDLMCDQTTNTTAQIKADAIKAYAVTTRERVKSLPDLPTLDESGLPGFDVSIWWGLYTAKGTPRPVVDKLSAALQAALADETVIARFAQLGTEPVKKERATPEALRAHLNAEVRKWEPVIRAAGVYAD